MINQLIYLLIKFIHLFIYLFAYLFIYLFIHLLTLKEDVCIAIQYIYMYPNSCQLTRKRLNKIKLKQNKIKSVFQ